MDKNNHELLLIGKGIGFNKRKGHPIQVNDSVEIYPMKYSEHDQKILELIDEIPGELILMVEDTMKGAEEILGTKLNYTLIFTLTSHIYYALKREDDIDSVTLPFQYGLDHIYPEEYEAAEYSVKYLKEKYNLPLKNSEVVFFTLHFVNALPGSNKKSSAMDTANILHDIIEVFEEEELVDLENESVHFSRFLTHIRYFLIRQHEGKLGKDDEFKQLSDFVSNKFEDASKIVQRIKFILEEKYNFTYSYEENVYLLLHTQRLIEENQKNNE